MKGKFKQRWAAIPPISANEQSPLNSNHWT